MREPSFDAARPLASLSRAARRWLAHRDTAQTLSRLSRHELSDIGVETGVDEYAWTMSSDAAER